MATQSPHFPAISEPRLEPDRVRVSLKSQRWLLKIWLVAADAASLILAYLIAYRVRFDFQVTLSPEVMPDPSFYPSLTAVVIAVWLSVFAASRLYDLRMLLGGVMEYSRIFNACTTGAMMLLTAVFLFTQLRVSRVWLITSWLLSLVFVALGRFLTRRLVYVLRGRGYFLVPTAIVGTNEEAHALAHDLRDSRYSGLRVLGFVSARRDESDLTGDLPVLGAARDIAEIAAKHGIEDLVVAITSLDRQELLQLCEEVNSLSGINLRLSSGLYEMLATNMTVQTLGGVPLSSVNKVRLAKTEIFLKTAFEYTVTLLVLALVWPLMAAIAIAVRLDSPGSLLHRRRVMGISGQQFDAFKFRTMYIDGDAILKRNARQRELLKSDHKLKDDPRITRVGKVLRKYSLDELPQLFNVLKGQMSLVGPRMITAAEREKYGRHRVNLLTVKPGITGLWQVSGRSDLSYDERVKLDMYYLRNYSVWLDLQILLVQTPPAVLRGRGAY